MSKNYMLFYDRDTIVFPVKAKYDPYIQARDGIDVPGFCSGYPQFFGGKADRGEGILVSLRREIDEEGILTYDISGGVAELFDWGSYEDDYGRDIPCEFFCTRNWAATGMEWPSEKNWQKLGPRYREMCWVATAPKSAFNIGPRTTGWDIAVMLMAAGAAEAPDWAVAQMATSPNEEFMTSLTMDAFTEFLTKWTGDGLS